MTEGNGKFIKHTTTFRFNSTNNMVRAFQETGGVNIRRIRHSTSYNFKHFKDLNNQAQRIVEYFGGKVETVMNWHCTNGWECKEDLVRAFELPADTYFDWWDTYVHVTTYSLSSEQHRLYMQKMYLPMKEAGFTVYHKCEEIVTDANC